MASGVATLPAQFRALTLLPATRQLGLLAGIAAAVAIGVAAVLWGQSPNHRPLFTDLAVNEQVRVLDALQAVGIDHRIEAGGRVITVPAVDLHRARMELASQGLPERPATGYELLDQDTGFGTSRRMESARFQRAIEGELSRSISALKDVQSARVHLALPERSLFLRARARPSASVVVALVGGRVLDASRIAGIRHLVASSVPELAVRDVMVLDQLGALLSTDDEPENSLSGSHLAQVRDLEQTLLERVESILGAIVGAEQVRAQVAADIDFTRIESTRETYNPDGRDTGLVRSERILEGDRGNGAGGVPGAFANQPPPAGTVAVEDGAAAGEAGEQAARDFTRDLTRNYELDRYIERAEPVPGRVRRLSVAVVVAQERDAEGAPQVRTPEQLAELEGLVREAIGFDADRGDSIRVTEAPFYARAEEAPELIEVPLWEQPWVLDAARQLLAFLVVIVLLLAVLRPVLRSAVQGGVTQAQALTVSAAGDGAPQALAAPSVGGAAPAALPAAAFGNSEALLAQARQIAEQDPKLVAQLGRTWMGGDD